MKIVSCGLHAAAHDAGLFPRDSRPQIAFMGRSNVGKSSLINRLLGRKGLARTSKTPGRTRAIYFYLINERFYFVDLPGYGYARVPQTMREEWKGLVEAYLEGDPGPDLAVHLVDSRHDPTGLDQELLEWLRSRGIPLRVVLTKADKLSRNERSRAAAQGARVLALGPDEPPLLVSAVQGDGIPDLWRAIDGACASPRSAAPGPPPPRGGGVPDSRRSAGREPPRGASTEP